MPTSEDPYPQYKVVLLEPSSTPSPPHLIDADERIFERRLELHADGKAVAYPIRENGVDNLWVQPLDGSRGRQITTLIRSRFSTSVGRRTAEASAYSAAIPTPTLSSSRIVSIALGPTSKFMPSSETDRTCLFIRRLVK